MSANELDPRAYIPGSLREDKPKTEDQPIHALPMPPYDFQGNTTPTDNLEAGAGDLVERLLTDAAYLGIKNGSLPVIGRDCAEAAAQLAAVTAENARLREALNLIDALDPEEHIYGTSHDACRGLIIRMGQMARAALSQEAPK